MSIKAYKIDNNISGESNHSGTMGLKMGKMGFSVDSS